VRRYVAFGLSVASNAPLPGLPPASADAAADVTVNFAAGKRPVTDPAARDVPEDLGWRAIRRGPDGAQLFLAASHGGARAWSMDVSGDGASIEVRWEGAVDPADIAVLVEAGGLPTCLALKGVPLLHGCAIDAGERAILVIGESGAGKSTAAAAAVAGGRALLADDVAALTARAGGVYVEPGPAQLRMQPDTAAAFGWDVRATRRVFAEPAIEDKRWVELSVADGNYCAEPRPVGAIYVLAPRRSDEPRIDQLEPAVALPLLLGNTYADYAARRAALLPFWTRLAQEVAVFRLAAVDGVAAMPSLVDALVERELRAHIA
jgi:hypothetical protein